MRKTNEYFRTYFMTNIIIAIVLALVMTSCLTPAPDNFTPSEKIEFTTMQGLNTASEFRIFALESASYFWNKGLMTKEKKDEIVKLGNEFQKAINDASWALEAYHNFSDIDTMNLEQQIKTYQDLYVRFNDLVMPFIIKAVGE